MLIVRDEEVGRGIVDELGGVLCRRVVDEEVRRRARHFLEVCTDDDEPCPVRTPRIVIFAERVVLSAGWIFKRSIKGDVFIWRRA